MDELLLNTPDLCKAIWNCRYLVEEEKRQLLVTVTLGVLCEAIG